MNPAVDADLAATLRRLKLGQVIATLPERLALAKTNKLSHAEFLQIVLPTKSHDATPPQRHYEPKPPVSTRR